MSPTTQGAIVLITTLVVLLSGAPVAFGLGAIALTFLVVFQGMDALRVAAETFYSGLADFTLVSIPMFVMMGAAIGSSPAGKDLYEALDRWLYRVPGGLVISNIGACGIFAALTGSSPACCAAIGKMGIPEMRQRGYPGRLFVMQSSGGVATGEAMERYPVRMIESGPAAGALMAAAYGELTGHRDLIAFDMGGTTAKLALIEGGRPFTTTAFELHRVNNAPGSGLPMNIQAIDLVEIGAGGGSIAKIDALKRVTVGPESAGSEPGPACYKRGGLLPTVTDADVALGMIATLDWNIEGDDGRFAAAARAMGLTSSADLPAAFETLVRAIGIKVSLADEFAGITATRLAEQMARPENAAMRTSNRRTIEEADLLRFAEGVLTQA